MEKYAIFVLLAPVLIWFAIKTRQNNKEIARQEAQLRKTHFSD